MTTIINTPGNDKGGSGFGIVVIIILILVAGFLVYRYGIPRRGGDAGNINVTIPTGSTDSSSN